MRKRSALGSGGFTACLRSPRYTELVCPGGEREREDVPGLGLGSFFLFPEWERWAKRMSETYAEDGQEDVDQQVRAASALEEDAERREEDGEDDLADVARGERSVSDGLRERALGWTLGAYLAVKAMISVLFGLLVRVLWWAGLFCLKISIGGLEWFEECYGR